MYISIEEVSKIWMFFLKPLSEIYVPLSTDTPSSDRQKPSELPQLVPFISLNNQIASSGLHIWQDLASWQSKTSGSSQAKRWNNLLAHRCHPSSLTGLSYSVQSDNISQGHAVKQLLCVPGTRDLDFPLIQLSCTSYYLLIFCLYLL